MLVLAGVLSGAFDVPPYGNKAATATLPSLFRKLNVETAFLCNRKHSKVNGGTYTTSVSALHADTQMGAGGIINHANYYSIET